MPGSRESVTPTIQGSGDIRRYWEILARVCRISSQPVLSFTQVFQLLGSFVWASGLIPLGSLHLRPLRRHFHFSDLTSGLHHRIDQTHQSTYSGIGRIYFFSLLESISNLSRRSSRSLRTPLHSAGAPIWGIPRFQVLGPMQNASSISSVWSSKQ